MAQLGSEGTTTDNICLRMDWKRLRKLYVTEKYSLLMRLRVKKEPAVPLENNQASLKFKV